VPNVVWFAEVAAPVGNGSDAAETGTVLLGLTATTKAVSVATAAVEAALMVPERVPSLSWVVWVPTVVWFAEVAAPVGRGRLAALTATVAAIETGSVGVLGETATTNAVSVARGAVDAALIVPLLVPSLICVV
jgi:hypothetical protein